MKIGRFTLLIIFATVISFSTAAMAKTVTLKFNYSMPPKKSIAQSWHWYAEELEKLMELEPDRQQEFFSMLGPEGKGKAKAEEKDLAVLEEKRIDSAKKSFFESFHEQAERASETLKAKMEDERRRRQTLREQRAERKKKEQR